jgi:hypothetical protein
MTKSAICFVVVLAAASSAYGQIDATSLRSKYGTPVDRETFTARPGVQMIVDYGPNKLVCKIQVPAGMKIVGTAPPGVATKQNIDEVLEEVVPSASRGKELGRSNPFGAPEQTTTEYERVYIS